MLDQNGNIPKKNIFSVTYQGEHDINIQKQSKQTKMKYSVQLRIDSALVIWISVILSSLFIFSLKSNAQQDPVLMSNGEIFLSELGTSAFYDSGGPFSNYNPNENLTLTVYGTNYFSGCNFAQVSFQSYNINEGDTLKIYDGWDTNAPLLAELSGNFSPPVGSCPLTFTASQCDLTFHFTSDGGNTAAGWEAVLNDYAALNDPSWYFCQETDLIDIVDIFDCELVEGSVSCGPSIVGGFPSVVYEGCEENFCENFAARYYRYIPKVDGMVKIELDASDDIFAYFGQCVEVMTGSSCQENFFICNDYGKTIEFLVEADNEYYIIVQETQGLMHDEAIDFSLLIKNENCNDVIDDLNLTFFAKDTTLNAGEHEIQVMSRNFKDVVRFNFGLSYDPMRGRFMGLVEQYLFGEELEIIENDQCDGCFSIRWTDWGGYSDPDAFNLFSIRVELYESVLLSDWLSQDTTVFTSGLNTVHESLNVKFIIEESDVVLSSIIDNFSGYELYQNRPNPFLSETVIPFTLPKAEIVTIDIYDTFGRLMHREQSRYPSGYHEYNLQSINGSGSLFYRIKAGDFTDIKKMIRK